MQLEHDGVSLYVEVTGAAEDPPLLLLHGITASSRTWDWLVPSLADRFRVIAVDFRGHGRSGRAPGRYAPAAYVTDALAVLEQLADAPAIVVGHSLGGVTAAALAQQRPDLVRAMVLVDAPLGTMNASAQEDHAALFEGFRLMRQMIPGAQAAGMQPEAVAGMMAMMPTPAGPQFGQTVYPEAIAAMAAGLLEVDVTVLDPILDGTAQTAFDPSQMITVPTLVIAADPASPDHAARPADIERVRAASPAVGVHVVIGGGHLMHDDLQLRAEVGEQIQKFLAAH